MFFNIPCLFAFAGRFGDSSVLFFSFEDEKQLMKVNSVNAEPLWWALLSCSRRRFAWPD